MLVSSEVKNEFLKNFQNNILHGRKLLQNGNHRWGDRLFTELYFEIEKTDWLERHKKHQLIMIITNSWWIYLNSQLNRKAEGAKKDFIKYLDAYNRFFSFLSRLDEFDLFTNFWTGLLKKFIKVENLSVEGITKFISSFCIKAKEREKYLKLVELQILLMFLRKTVFPSDMFRFSLKILGEILFKLEPGKKALLLYVFMENLNIKYLEDSPDFVQVINKILANRIPSYLKEDFSNMRKISINERNFSANLTDLEELINYLNYIGENSWIIIIIRYLFAKIKQFQTFEEAIIYIRNFIDYSISRNQFQIAYEIYDFLEDVLMYKTDLGYDNYLIELWVEACKKFADMKEQKYLLQAMEKLNNHLKIPQSSAQTYHYFYTCNYLWKFRSKFFSLDPGDFWRMVFYRTLYEEKDIEFAKKIMMYLDENLRSKITDLNSLYNVAESLKPEMYSFDDGEDTFESINTDFIIKRMILRINSKGLISFHLNTKDGEVVKGKIINEYWNDLQIMEIYNDIFSGTKEKRYNLNLAEFGKLLYNFLPISLRNIFKQVKESNSIPQIYFIIENMTVPFGLVYDDNFFMLKYSSSYKIGEPHLSGNILEDIDQNQQSTKSYDVLLIEAINAKGPFKWNEVTKQKELIFPFPLGSDELNHIANFFNNRPEINQLKILNGFNSTREKILSHLSQDPLNIIHFVGNIFYSKWSPKDSYILTNDNNLITFHEIKRALDKNRFNQHPILFFNAQIFNIEGERLKNVLRTFGEIVSQFDYESVTGIVSRNYPLFSHETREITTNFYNYLLKSKNQGEALLRSRQQCNSGLAISSFLLFGKPWKTL